MAPRLYVQDVTLRGPLRATPQRLTPAAVRQVVAALDNAGVDAIEVAHRNGLGGGSVADGPDPASEWTWIEAAAEVLADERLDARLSTWIVPGVGQRADLHRAWSLGVRSARIVAHGATAGLATAHVETARSIGLDVAAVLTLDPADAPDDVARRAQVAESSGAGCVYLSDAVGRLSADEVRERVHACRVTLDPRTEIGIHARHGDAVSSSIAAVEAGATRVDTSVVGDGACPLAPLLAAANNRGWRHNCDLASVRDADERLAHPLWSGSGRAATIA